MVIYKVYQSDGYDDWNEQYFLDKKKAEAYWAIPTESKYYDKHIEEITVNE